MSGICAVWRRDHPGRTAATLAAVSEGLVLAAGEHVAEERDPLAGVGVCARFASQQVLRTERVLCACDADLDNLDDLVKLAGDEKLAIEGPIAGLLVALYERFGDAFVERLRGGFSFVLWDRRKRRLIAAVDHFGVKRLAYYQDAALTLVASRLDALIRASEVSRKINPHAIANVVNYSISPGPETSFAAIHRIPPGSMLIVADRHLSVRKYWDMSYDTGSDTNEDRLSQELERMVEASVARKSKAPSFDKIGCFLSGGTDSSTIVGLMARQQRGPVQAFSIGFQEQPFNEMEYAEMAASKFQADHHTYFVSPQDCFEALPHMVRYFDEPFGNSSAIPTYFCARLAAQKGMKILLGGDGGDELFGGNEAYRTDKIFEYYQEFPAALRKGLIEPVLNRLPIESGLIGKIRRYVRRSNLPNVERMLSYHFLCTHAFAGIFDAGFLGELADYSTHEAIAQHYSQAPARNPLDRRLYADVKTTIGDSDLPKVTCMAELAGIQVRFPFLDVDVAEFSGRIPARLKVKGLEKRYLFKRAFRNLLPQEIIKKRKHGFGIPVATWINSDPAMREFSRDVLLSSRARERGYFRQEFIADLIRKSEADETTYYGDTLWVFLVLELWHREFLDQPAAVSA
jgi:asparagine synthase (glutamine-hydrolysing)